MVVERKKWHHRLTQIRKIHPLVMLVLCLLAAGTSVLFLRQNNLHMAELRTNVYQADEQNEDVEQALRELRGFVYAHMNTDLTTGTGNVYPPIQLKYTYERLVAAEAARVEAANSKVYSDAQAYCEAQQPTGFSGGTRVPCIEAYVTSNGQKAQPIPDSLYKFDFISASFSFDKAGWSLIVTAILAVLFIARLAVPAVLKRVGVR